MQASIRPAGVSVWQSNDAAAGREAPHVHFHALARQPNDGLLRVSPEKPRYPDRSTLDQLAIALRNGFPTERDAGDPDRDAGAKEWRP